MEQQQLKTLLQDTQVEERLRAVRCMSDLTCFASDLFVLALGDDDWRVRKEAVTYFMQQADASSYAEFLVNLLGHPDNAGLRNAAIEILIGLGAQVVAPLLEHLATGDAEVRKFIVDILGEIGQETSSPELLPYLQDEDQNVRYAVVETLGKIRAVAAVDALLDLLETADAGLQFTIFEALATIGAGVPVTRILPYAQNSLLRKSVFTCLGQLGSDAAIPALLKGLSDPLRKNRQVALLSIGQLIRSLQGYDFSQVDPQSEQVVDWLVDLLHHESLDLRRAACCVLCLFPTATIVDEILPLLAQDDIRSDIVAVAKLIPKDILTTHCCAATLDNKNAIYLIFLLGELGYSEIAPLAIAGITSEDPQFRYASTIALGKICAVEATALLCDVLADDISEIREAASEALCRIGSHDPAAMIETVSPYLESTDVNLRLLAVRTLGALPTDLVEKFMLQTLKDVSPEIRCEALRGLSGHESTRLLSGLSLALTDENSDVRRLAATAIGFYPAQRSTPLLEHALDDSDPWVRMSAIRALKPGDKAILEVILSRGVSDPVGLVVIATLEMVCELLPDQAMAYLLTALDHNDEEVVRTAVRILLESFPETSLLDHDRQLVRLLAIDLIQRLTGPMWLEKFEERLRCERDLQVRQSLESALRKGAAGS